MSSQLERELMTDIRKLDGELICIEVWNNAEFDAGSCGKCAVCKFAAKHMLTLALAGLEEQ